MAEEKERRISPPKIGIVSSLIIKAIVFFVILLGVISFFIFNYQKNFIERMIMDKNAMLTRTYAAFMSDAKQMGDDLVIIDYIERLKRIPTIRYVLVLDQRSKVLFHSDMREVGKTYQDAVSLKTVASEEEERQKVKYEGETVLDFSAPITVSHKKVATLRIGFSTSNIDAATEDMKENITAIAIAGIVVVIVGSFVMNSGIGYGISQLKQTAKEISRGELPEKIEVKGSGEIGYLARVLERMFARIRQNFNQIEEQKKETKRNYDFFIQNICEYFKNGVIAMDDNNRIIYANEIAARIVGFPVMSCLGKHMLEIIKNAELIEFINFASQKPNTLNEKEIISLNCSACVKVVKELEGGRQIGVIMELKGME
ncbi:MAG: HAMP domain-containing protein [Elusimicrobia bacterium]|nr:HAMP domain-containing protein [Elusimicrobiota bacterium]